ncbi:nitroreductase [Acuticoccus sp. I52.16.1]|uniref:nitroreductase family protein n=1 Tax=Acuticoccus sp. I52.16.1 TaxID=2928472 RepID=UPI001FD4D215|nr:nitroreductase [Acuticoccus sp. I52.16.1]UOM33752.1 nitroreductase [Acuticoccus sp. I52.16.1]
MRELRDYLATRRTTAASFLDSPSPEQATLDRMLSIATRVPDHGKLAPWRFIVIEGAAREAAGEIVARIAAASGTQRDLAEERGRFTRAPLVVAVVSTAAPHVKIPEWEQVLSAGAVCLNLVHAAHAFGYSAQWLSEWIAYDREVLRALGVADGENVAGFIHIGTPQFVPADRDRPALEAVVTRFEPG